MINGSARENTARAWFRAECGVPLFNHEKGRWRILRSGTLDRTAELPPLVPICARSVPPRTVIPDGALRYATGPRLFGNRCRC